MTNLVIFALPLLTALAAWLLFLHLARSGRRVTLPPADAEALRLARERIRAMEPMFAQLTLAASQAAVSFNAFGRALREALERETKARASGRETENG